MKNNISAKYIEDKKESYFHVINEEGKECKVYVSDKTMLKIVSKPNYEEQLVELVNLYRRNENLYGGELESLRLEGDKLNEEL